MLIPRGFIPGANAPYYAVDINSGTIDGTFIGSASPSEGNFSKLVSPEIKAFLASHDYQYVYDWSVLPANSNFKWTKHGTGEETVTDGILTNTVTGPGIYYTREADTVNPNWSVIADTEIIVTAGTDKAVACLIGDGQRYFTLYVSALGEVQYFNELVQLESIATVIPTEYNKFTVLKDAQNKVYVFINGELASVIDYDSIYNYAGSMIGFGVTAGDSTVTYSSRYFKYSILKEGSKDLNGTSGKVVGGNYDVYNQAETEGIRQSSTKIESLGANQDVIIDPNGIGGVVLNSQTIVNGIVISNSPNTSGLKFQESGIDRFGVFYAVGSDYGYLYNYTSGASPLIFYDIGKTILGSAQNGDIELAPNGTGGVKITNGPLKTSDGTTVIDQSKNVTGAAIIGALYHKYSGVVSNAIYNIDTNDGYVLSSTASNDVDVNLPDASSSLGRVVTVNNNSSLNQTTVTCTDANDRIYYNGVTTYTTVTLAGFPKYVQLMAMNSNIWQVISHYGATFS